MKRGTLITLALAGSLLGSAQAQPKLPAKKTYTVGFAQPHRDNGWRWAQYQSLQDEAARLGHQLVHANAGGSEDQQWNDVQALLTNKVDVLLLSPLNDAVATKATKAARAAGVPLFILDRPVNSKVAKPGVDYVTYVGSDYALQAQRVAEWLVKKTGGKAQIIELQGELNAPATQARKEGFQRALSKQSGMKILSSQEANDAGVEGEALAQRLISTHPTANVVFAHDLIAATHAAQAVRLAGKEPGRDVLVVTIDGSRTAMLAVSDQHINITVDFSPRFGPAVFDAIRKYAAGQKLPARVILNDRLFDARTAAEAASGAHF